jgi:peptide/nickel transport system substrate-binding protein
MSKGIYIGLGSMLFLAFIASLALFEVFQQSQVEARLIRVDQQLAELQTMKGDLGRINAQLGVMEQLLRERPAQVIVSGGVGEVQGSGGGKAAGGECKNNMLVGDQEPWLPEGVKADMTARIVRAIPAGSKGFNPLTESGADVQEIERYVNAYVAERSPKNPNDWRGYLASCVEVNGDFTEYTVHLKPNIFWHPIQSDYLKDRAWLQGDHPLTADDFIFTIDMIMDPAVEGAAPLRSYYKDVERLEKIDDLTFKVIWKKKTFQSKTFTLELPPTPAWIYAHDPNGKPYPKATRGQNFNQHWYVHMMGVGPYRMDSFKENEYIKLVRNEQFFGPRHGFLEIVYKVVGDATQRMAQFESRQLEMVVPVSPSEYNEITTKKAAQYIECKDATCAPGADQFAYGIFARMAYRYIGWNLKSALFSDKRVRRAMTHALNRPVLLKQIFHGLGIPISGNFYPLGPEYNPDIEPLDFNLDTAKKLLDEAGWIDRDGDGIRDKDGKKFEFTLLVYGYRPEFISLGEYFRDDLARIGVSMKIDPLDWSLMQTKIAAKDFDAFTGGWALGWEADPYQIWHSSQADQPESSNHVGFKNEEADKIIEEARLTFDTDARVRLFHRFHEIVHEEQPYTFLFSDRAVAIWQPVIRNVVFQPNRPHDISFPWYRALP